MRILGIGRSNDLGSMYLSLQRAGHEVRVYVDDPAERDILAGLVPQCTSWRDELPWVRAAGDDGIVVFENSNWGPDQETLRRQGYHVIGGSTFGDRLETDRAFGQQILAEAGMQVLPTFGFQHCDDACTFLRTHPGRYVYKPNRGGMTYVGQTADGTDLIDYLSFFACRKQAHAAHDFVLMEYVEGVEVGVGAYFNGQQFMESVCLDWEHKHLFPGDLGELTGEMGTLVTYRGADRLFAATLARLAPWLSQSGYVGYININTIVNERGIWPLELTCRFGYPGFAILQALHDEDWGTILHRLVHARGTSFATRPGYAVGVVLSVPPFPYAYGYAELAKGLPVAVVPPLGDDERDALHLCEIALKEGRWVTAGTIGYLMVATGCGESVAVAQCAAYKVARKVIVPGLRYRNDIGNKFLSHDEQALRAWGWLT